MTHWRRQRPEHPDRWDVAELKSVSAEESKARARWTEEGAMASRARFEPTRAPPRPQSSCGHSSERIIGRVLSSARCGARARETVGQRARDVGRWSSEEGDQQTRPLTVEVPLGSRLPSRPRLRACFGSSAESRSESVQSAGATPVGRMSLREARRGGRKDDVELNTHQLSLDPPQGSTPSQASEEATE